MHDLLAKLEPEGISIFSFKAVTICLRENWPISMGLRSAEFSSSRTDVQTSIQPVCFTHVYTCVDSK